MELYLKKTVIGLVPSDELSQEALEKYHNGTLLLCKLVQPRNPKFHDKFMALLRVGFKYWQPGEIECKHGTPAKNFDQFRKDVTILAGFYEAVIRLNGETRIEAKSISFGKMTDDDFRELYSAVINVLLQNIFKGYTEEQVVKLAADEILNFT